MEERAPNPHPGEVLREDYLMPLHKTAEWLAEWLRMSLSEVNEILDAKRPITAATALRLNRLFGASAEFWLHYQAAYDLAEERFRLADELDAIQRYRMPHLAYDENGEILGPASPEEAELGVRR
jgi:antitoxin HigA-1